MSIADETTSTLIAELNYECTPGGHTYRPQRCGHHSRSPWCSRCIDAELLRRGVDVTRGGTCFVYERVDGRLRRKIKVGQWYRTKTSGHEPTFETFTDGTIFRCVEFPVHPYPPTLDAAAKALPPGWGLTKGTKAWRASRADGESVVASCTDNETLDRYRLAVAAWMVEEKEKVRA